MDFRRLQPLGSYFCLHRIRCCFDTIPGSSESNERYSICHHFIADHLYDTVYFFSFSMVLTGMVKYDQLDLGAPVASAFATAGLNWLHGLLHWLAGLVSVMLVMMLSQTRIFLGHAKDGLLPRGMFASIHPRFKTPWKSTILVGAIVSVCPLTPIDKVSEMTSIGTLLAFAMICAAVWILER